MALALALCAGGTAHATTIAVSPDDSSWHQLDVAPDFALSGGFEWIDAATNEALSFTFTNATSILLTIVDGGFAGDRFEVFDGSASLGLTSLAGNSFPNSVGVDFDTALTNSAYSFATFLLAPGTHTISGRLTTSALLDDGTPLNSTVGGLRLTPTPVPLPASALFLMSGTGLLAFLRRRRGMFRRWGAALGLGVCALGATAAQAQTTSVKLIAFNDFHGNLESPGLFSGSPSGGVDVLATYVNNLKAQNPNSVVVSAGDLIGASPLISAFFHDEGAIETMNRLGLEFNAVGNHEFDEGRTELLRMQNGGCHPSDPNSCQGATVGTPVPFEGAKFKILSANVVDTTSGKTLLAPYGIKVLSNGLRIGFIGLTLKETPGIVTPSGVAGLTFKDEAATVNALVPQLRARGVEAIVVLIHQGGFQASAQPNFINDCSGALQDDANSPIRAIVRNLDNAVDLVVSGHTHTGYNCRLPNRVGRTIPVTQASAFGRMLTDIDLTLDNKTGDVLAASANNIIVNRSAAGIVPNATIASIVDGYRGLVSPLANAIIGTITGPATNIANTAGEMSAGDIIADAQLAATAPAQFGGAVVAFMNAGGVRNPGFVASSYPHDVTYAEAFTVQPFGNTLVTMTLTTQQIKDVLEQQFLGCLGQIANRIMQVSSTLHYTYQPVNSCGSKIVDVTLNNMPIVSNGQVLNPTQTYRVTVNNFMATGGDGFAVLTGGTNLLPGISDIDALIPYMANFKAPNPPYDPAVIAARIVRLPPPMTP